MLVQRNPQQLLHAFEEDNRPHKLPHNSLTQVSPHHLGSDSHRSTVIFPRVDPLRATHLLCPHLPLPRVRRPLPSQLPLLPTVRQGPLSPRAPLSPVPAGRLCPTPHRLYHQACPLACRLLASRRVHPGLRRRLACAAAAVAGALRRYTLAWTWLFLQSRHRRLPSSPLQQLLRCLR
jgi:hypothetical protein